MVTKTCKVCGESKEAVKGTWVTLRGMPEGKTCLACKVSIAKAIRTTEEGREKYNAYFLARYYKDPNVRVKLNECNRLRRSTPEGASYAKAATLKSSRKIRATEVGKAAHSARNLAWAARNPDKHNARGMLRHVSKLHRTPAWADLRAIQEFYTLATQLTASTGIVHSVDHVIPLRGKLVSGLHVHNNLQVITKTANSSKGNKFDLEEFNSKHVI